MSRIHEALLRAQKERGVRIDSLDRELLQPKVPTADPSIPREPFVDDQPLSAVDERLDSSDQKSETFIQHDWAPDQNRLPFLRSELSDTGGVEEFRTLRSRLLRERTRRHLKTVLITGVAAGEGKTFVAANLATAMARNPSGRSLVVDADLRRPSLHSVFGMQAKPGLSNFLSGALDEAAAIVCQTPEPRLCVVTAGLRSETPTELLHSGRMEKFIQRMGGSFDWIFIDSPPAVGIADTLVLSELCDAVLMVIAPGSRVALLQKACKDIGHKILGIVINQSEDPLLSYGYYGRAANTKIRAAHDKNLPSRKDKQLR